MNIIIAKDYKEMSQAASQMIEEQMTKKPDTVLGLATGGTPLGTYKELINSYKEGRTDYRFLSTINLDEYVGLDPEHHQSYRYFMNQNFFQSINIDEKNTYIPFGKAEDLVQECRRYEEVIDTIGPPDLQLLGIGENGHIGFNEPGTSFDSETHIVHLTDSTREANARFFESMEDVPTKAITMGIRSILKSQKIILLASGDRKSDAIYQLLHGETDEDFPASSLKSHHDLTLIVDEDAYKKVQRKG
ncbi:glucosamine-6-phosphate deaminase [Halobacillus sp. Nhm2S1]|uniref:glucosamine-6-phosphate deaminase n=1 Tax=Halobacillus sp. Nhm2S1 TaxID=2866716 RepID=UPI001C72D8B9|nr:glucosamine-6-phosphate deaminase [Halobacillus sp. Nhm2S1]MBX0357147.1 glucosamine-6-phosphate deaminase [Halobacillus sp. Nhm2S1]